MILLNYLKIPCIYIFEYYHNHHIFLFQITAYPSHNTPNQLHFFFSFNFIFQFLLYFLFLLFFLLLLPPPPSSTAAVVTWNTLQEINKGKFWHRWEDFLFRSYPLPRTNLQLISSEGKIIHLGGGWPLGRFFFFSAQLNVPYLMHGC